MAAPGVGCASRRMVGEPSGAPPAGDAVLLAAEPDGVQHARAVRTDEVERLARRAQREAELKLVPRQKAPRLDEGAVRNAEPVRRRIVGQHAPGQVHARVRAVVELDEIRDRIVRVGEEFVDDHARFRDWARWDPAPRANRPETRSPPRRAGRPRRSWAAPAPANGPAPSADTGQGGSSLYSTSSRMASALLRSRSLPAVVRQRPGVRAEHVRDAIHRLEVVRRGGDDHRLARLQPEDPSGTDNRPRRSAASRSDPRTPNARCAARRTRDCARRPAARDGT